MAAVLVTLAQAKLQLRITDTDHDADIQLKLDQAEPAIVNYCGSTAYWRTVAATWINPTTVPKEVQAAILILLTHLYEHRGDDMASDEGVWTAIDRLLKRYRDPVLA